MGRILVVDDDLETRNNIKKYLQFEGYGCCEACNGLDAIKTVKSSDIDLITMDIMMPELDGFSAIKEIRKISNVPIIILSARNEEFDRIHGFECGCDDYVSKPFSIKELVMRIAAVLKRCGAQIPECKETYTNGPLVVDFTGRLVTLEGKELMLSPREYNLLFYLVKNKDIALTREKILNDVWGFDFVGDDRTIDTHIKQLRQHLGSYGKHIATVRGIGYTFRE